MIENEIDDAREIELAELDAVMATLSGRNVINRLINNTGFFADAFNPDPYVNARNAGGRQIGVWLWNELNEASPGKVIEMIKENAHVD